MDASAKRASGNSAAGCPDCWPHLLRIDRDWRAVGDRLGCQDCDPHPVWCRWSALARFAPDLVGLPCSGDGGAHDGGQCHLCLGRRARTYPVGVCTDSGPFFRILVRAVVHDYPAGVRRGLHCVGHGTGKLVARCHDRNGAGRKPLCHPLGMVANSDLIRLMETPGSALLALSFKKTSYLEKQKMS